MRGCCWVKAESLLLACKQASEGYALIYEGLHGKL